MKILSYNCRGLIGAPAVRALLKVLKRNDPDIVFLSETHLDEWPTECIRRKAKLDFKEVITTDSRSGGLLMMWKKEADVSLRFKTKNFIDVYVGLGHANVWRFTGMYGEPRWQDKHQTWQCLRDLHATVDMPWLVMGTKSYTPLRRKGETQDHTISCKRSETVWMTAICLTLDLWEKNSHGIGGGYVSGLIGLSQMIYGTRSLGLRFCVILIIADPTTVLYS